MYNIGVFNGDGGNIFGVFQQLFWLQFFVIEVNYYYFVVKIGVECDIMNCVNWYDCCWCVDCYVVVVQMVQFYNVIDIWVFGQEIVFNYFYYIIDYVCYIVYVGGNVKQIFGVDVVIGVMIVFKCIVFQWWQWFWYFGCQWQCIQWWCFWQFNQ